MLAFGVLSVAVPGAGCIAVDAHPLPPPASWFPLRFAFASVGCRVWACAWACACACFMMVETEEMGNVRVTVVGIAEAGRAGETESMGTAEMVAIALAVPNALLGCAAAMANACTCCISGEPSVRMDWKG